MFKIGEKVKLVRHDYYPGLVGSQGVIGSSGREDPHDARPAPGTGKNETVYRIIFGSRVLHDIPESWLQHS